ncbi:hypothetical protein Asi02nite_20060 [Asanoa siamensis]|uniref:Uncharacterized protein n=1 Tax=Asanoa siamensis TaxID=926357 RepID=A0ABQ4CNC5_9ACTN|nr:hypothetical protein Asi02nite_20060 [Asanoa siamensis]
MRWANGRAQIRRVAGPGPTRRDNKMLPPQPQPQPFALRAHRTAPAATPTAAGPLAQTRAAIEPSSASRSEPRPASQSRSARESPPEPKLDAQPTTQVSGAQSPDRRT